MPPLAQIGGWGYAGVAKDSSLRTPQGVIAQMCRSVTTGEPRRCASRTNYAAAATMRRHRRLARDARRAVASYLSDQGLPKAAAAVMAAPPSMLAEFIRRFGVPASVLGELPMPGTGPKPASAAPALRIAWTETRQARAARRAIAAHLTDQGLPQTAAAVLASPPSMLSEFVTRWAIPASVLADLPIPAPGTHPASAAAVLRLAATESQPLPAKNPAVPAVVDRDRAHVAKGRQALAHTTRPAPTRAPARPQQPQPSTRPPVDLEAVRRMAAALARVVAAQPEPEGKPNCGGNIELITKWEEHAEIVFAEGGSRAQCRAANAEAEMLCKGCPLMDKCARDAKENHYTGIAGGRIFIYGRQRLTPSRADRIVA